ncbi:hypothetical protein FLA105534_02720 [Flavobacterium bizetiae]|uniref:Uncharacterized protein n=2 Tax=Flavobacterium bizetiae TaxID=2704140 RepID=A0A6J4GNJ7_9FLAO|nr:gliding motility-associated C-terminal domain-containing protein [Flavobacterium bizetiae]CAA9199694.1 hypothetical protein FLA105534_02720 [Flavobacterium bizetiae]
MKKKLLKKLLFLVLFLFLAFKANAQYATSHYIAPSPWQYWSDANEIVLTTESATAVTVTLKKSDGTFLATRTVTSAAPDVYRFVGQPWTLQNNPVNTIEDDRGLIVESTGGKVSVNLRNVASDQANGSGGDTNGGTIKGNASLVSFGNEGRGTSFRLGYYRTDFSGIQGFNGAAGRPVYAVMAIDDATQVKLNGTNLVLLNKGQSYLFQPINTGDLLESDKPVVANTGAYTDAPGGCGDGAVDQMAPVSILGNRYIVVRGSGTAGTGTNLPEQSTIIATESGTNITIKNYDENGNIIGTTPITLALAGDHKSIHHGDANTRYSSSIIESNKPIAVYSGTAQSCEVDIATVLPVGGCSGSKWTSTSQFKGYIQQVLPYFGFVLVESATAPVFVNGNNIETTTGINRFQLGTTGVYLIRFENTHIGNPPNITITSAARMNVGVVQQGGGFSMSGFFSSFNETPDLPQVTKDSNGCAINIITADPGLEPYQWYFDGALIPGATGQSIVPLKTGNYSITGTRDCGVTGKSAAIYVAVCGDREVEKTVANGPATNQVIFTVTAKNHGPNEDRNVTVTDALPSGYTLVTKTESTGTYDSGTGIWNIGNMAVNATATLTITATVINAGAVTNTATITGDNLDNTVTNDSDTATPLAKLELVKTARTGVFNSAGDVITYDLVVTNAGKVPVRNIFITDANADSGSISPASVAVLLPGASASFTATHTVTQADLIAEKVVNSAKADGVDGSNNPVSDTSGTDIDNDTPTETVTKSVIVAGNDTVNNINGRIGKNDAINIFANDNINGTVVAPADVTVTVKAPGVPTGLTLNANGNVDVAAGTAAGTYTFDYTICEVGIPLNCDDAKVTIVVTTINADNDTPDPINGKTGGTIPTVFGNDTLDGAAFLPADVTLTTSTTLPTGLTLNSDGTITVAANTAPGTHVISYTICQKANPLICDDATTTVIVTTINADNDTPDPINGTTGGTIPTVFGNDTLDGAAFLPTDVTLTTSTTLPTGLTLNPNGTITVAANTAPGTHVVNYTICQKANPLICDDATTTVIVTTINADNDTPDPINGTTGGTIPTVFGNDTLDGAAFLPADVTLTTSTTLPTGLTLNSDGTITVAANTAPGTHVISYTICQKANPLICDDATTTVIVTTINADNDTPDPINGTTGGTIPTVFGNDTLDGAAFLPTDVTLTTSTTLPTGLTLNSDGTITVAANTAPGTHVVNYTICQKANPLICDDATTTVIVTTINADNDTPDPINGTTGGTIPTVFGNDTLDGAAFLPADVTLTTSTTLPTGLTLNSNGTITVAANTAPGTHVISYTICQKANPLICDDATTTVIVTTINADNDTPDPINGTTGGTIPTVFGNDTLDGAAFLPTDVTLTTSTTLPTGLTLNSYGTITVAANTAPGTHLINYTICQKANPLICDDATTTVIVTTINADNDTPDPINGTTGGTIPTVFGNDTLDGIAFVPADVTLTTSTTLPTGLTLNTDGTITVAANTAPGTHVINYTICQKANPLICDDANTTVIVTTINADNDTPDPINGTTGGTIPTVFGNDTLDGATFLPADVTLTTSTTLPTGLTLNSNGTTTVAANTAPGTHVINYTICQKANPLICDDANTTVIVTTINADNDTPDPINGKTGGTIPTVFGNDTLDGAAFLPADVTLTTSTTLPTGLTLNSDGTITVAANTAPGTHVINYTICQKANPLICDDATTTVVITTINADNDTPDPINGTTGGTIPTVFGNDTLDGATFLPADVTLTTSTTLPTGLTLNTDGTITVAANTAPGTHVINYTICQKANPLICDDATTTVIVTTINADNDTPDPINGTTSGTIPTVFGNDTLDGAAFLPTDVTLTTSTTLPTGLTLNSDGTITVAANTAPGTHLINYTICQKANPLICDDATTTVIVTTINADNDTPDPINGTTGGTIPTVFGNETLDGIAFVPADVTLTTSTTLPTGLTLNTDGTITVAANTAPGTHVISYTICQKANPLICDDANTTVIVTTINADNDTPDPINGTTGGTIPTVFGNDTLDGVAFSPADVTLTTSTTLPTGLTLNQDGTITIAANTAPGTHVINYTICQKANPLICDDATIEVVVQVPSVEVIKKGTFNDANGDGFAQKGETITYNFSVVNTGTMQLTNVVVTDPMVTVTGGPIAVLNVGAKDDTTFSATYTITQADVDAGSINNQALVTASPIVGTPISNLSDSNDPALPGKNDPTITKLSQNPGLKLLKQGIFEDANHDGSVSEGDRINYVFRVINTGNVTIKDIVVSDPMVTVSGGPISLEPQAFDATTFKASYVLTQSDIDLGAVYNLALVTGNDPNGVSIDNDSEDVAPLTPKDKFYEPACPTCTVTTLEQKSGIALIKTAVFNDENNNGNAEAGETITYRFVITNTGNVRLSNITITDPLPGIVMTGGPISLAPGESDSATFKGTYALKQSDINSGKVSNQAFVTGQNPLGVIVNDASDDTDNSGNNPTVLAIQGCVIKIFNAMSPNGDAKNERFYIQGLECYPDNRVEIYNRWGVLVFERENYNNEERAFRGISEGRTTVKQSDGLPVGTYYYILKYKDSDSNAHQEAGYLYLSK